MSYHGYYLWISQKMLDMVTSSMREERHYEQYDPKLDKKFKDYIKPLPNHSPITFQSYSIPDRRINVHMVESGAVYQTVCVTKTPEHGTAWDDIWTPGRIICSFGNSYPPQNANVILAIAYGIWQETALCFDYLGPRSVRFITGHEITIDSTKLTVVERGQLQHGDCDGSFSVNIQENGSLERVLEAVKNKQKRLSEAICSSLTT